jgi:hypothetical protein
MNLTVLAGNELRQPDANDPKLADASPKHQQDKKEQV